MSFGESRNARRPRSAARWRSRFVLLLCAVATTVFAPHRAVAGLNQWTSSGPLGAGVNAVATNPYAPGIIYAGTAGHGVFKSCDGGETWAAVNDGLGDIYIEQVVVHPIITTLVYATSPNHGVFESRDAGETWTAINSGLPTAAAHHLTLDPLSSTLYVSSDAGLFVSHDGGAHWSATQLRTKGARKPGDDVGLFAWIDCLAFDPVNGSVYACYFDWSDAGPGWQLLRSADAGETWHEVALPSGGGPVAMTIQPGWHSELYVATYEPFELTARVLRSTDDGVSWELLGGALPSCTGGCRLNGLAVAGDTVYAAGQHGVLVSAAGADWIPLARGMDDRAAFAVAVDADPALAHAATSDGVFSISRAACAGDCDGDGAVGVGELVTVVDIVIGRSGAALCRAADINGDARIAVNDLVAAVAQAMHGCVADA